jgi:hypothetical protein
MGRAGKENARKEVQAETRRGRGTGVAACVRGFAAFVQGERGRR